MTVLAVGDEHDSYARHQTPRYGTSVKSANASYNLTVSSGGHAYLGLSSPVSECWTHFVFLRGTILASTSVPFFGLLNRSTGKLALRFMRVGSDGRIAIQYNSSGVAYTTIATVYTTDLAVNLTVDVYFKRGASGALKLFMDGVLIHSSTGNYTTVDADWDTIYFSAPNTNTNTYQYGDVIVSSTASFRRSLASLSPSGSGTVNDWTGDHGDLSGSSGLVTDTNAVHTASTGDDYLLSYENMPSVASNQQIKAVSFASACAIDAASSIGDVSLLVRHGGTTYDEGSLGASPGLGTNRGGVVLELNPAGGVWTSGDIDAIEVGGRTS